MKIDLKGIQSNISDLNVNGSAKDVIGLRNKYGEWKDIKPVEDVLNLSPEGENYYIHYMNDSKYYWYHTPNTNQVMRYEPESGMFEIMKQLSDGEEFYSFIHFGNFFMINTSLGSYKFIYDEGTYVELPELPKLKWHISTAEREVLKDEEQPSVMDDGLWQSRILSMLQQIINNAAKKGKVQGHTLFMLAFETVSGEYIMPTPIQYNYLGSVLYEENRYDVPNGVYEQDFNHSQEAYPINPDDPATFSRPSDVFGSMITYGMSSYDPANTSDNFIKVLHGGFFVKPKIILNLSSSDLSILEKYDGLISNISVFITKPEYDYDLDNDNTVYYGRTCSVISTHKNNFLFYKSKGLKSEDIINDNISFYKLGKFDIQELLNSETEKTFEVKNIETKEVFTSQISHVISGKTCLDYNDRIHLSSIINNLTDVNNLSVNDNIQSWHHPIPTYFSQGYESPDYPTYAIVKLKINNDIKTIVTEYDVVANFDSGTGKYYILNSILSYPDSRAFEMNFIIYASGAYRKITDTITLTPHESLNLSYNIKDITSHDVNYTFRRVINSGATSWLEYSIELDNSLTFDILEYRHLAQFGLIVYENGISEDRYYHDKNRIQLSANSDPLSWPAINSYRVGRLEQEVKSLAVNTIQLSEGQYGEHPLFVFSEAGVFALVKGNDTVYSSVVPVNTDVILNNKAVSTKVGVVFASERGLVLQSGRESLVLSQALDGELTHNINDLDQFKKLTNGTYDTGNMYGSLTKEGKIDFSAVVIGYDFENDELYMSIPDDYTFIFNTLSKQWYKRKESWKELITDSGKLNGISSSGVVQDINGTNGFVSSTDFLYISNPISIDNVELKKYLNVHLPYKGDNQSIGQQSHNLGVYVFGSNNLQEWKMIAGKRFKQTRLIELKKVRVSAKYHVFVIAGNQTNPVFKNIDIELL